MQSDLAQGLLNSKNPFFNLEKPLQLSWVQSQKNSTLVCLLNNDQCLVGSRGSPTMSLVRVEFPFLSRRQPTV